MFNKIILSLLFGAIFFGIVGYSEAYAANANLYVSAENSQFDNYMSGPQVIEVVVIDSDINDTDEQKGEPDVTVNSKILRMVQAVDGNWYGYFADRTLAQIADSTTTVAGQGLDFGKFCSADSAGNVIGVSFSETAGVSIPIFGAGSIDGSPTGEDITSTCVDDATSSTNGIINVLREARDVNTNSAGNHSDEELAIIGEGSVSGQIGIDSDKWPFIQLYNLNPTGDVVVQYNKGGGIQSTTLTFDTVDQFADVSLDRTVYPQNSQIHATITDLWLNIDPTDEDSWTFGTNDNDGLTTNYMVFDENGIEKGASVSGGIIDISSSLDHLMIEDNGRLIIDINSQGSSNDVLTIQDNENTGITCTDPQNALSCSSTGIATGLGPNSQPITITEQGPSSGVFVTYDEADISTILIADGAKRGTSATIDYNETPSTILVGFGFGTIDIVPSDNEWNSGEEYLVELTDTDANKNSRSDEDLDLFNPRVQLIPALQTGNPFTLETLTTSTLSNSPLVIEDVERFSQRAILSTTQPIELVDGDTLHLTTAETFSDLYNSINDPNSSFSGFNFFNYDIRSLQMNVDGDILFYDVYLTDGISSAKIVDGDSSFQGLVSLSDALDDDVFSMNPSAPVQIIFTFDVDGSPTLSSDTVLPLVADFFSFGFYNDGLNDDERVANQLIRLELEESGDNTSTFDGSLEFVMINQLNVLDENMYLELNTIADDPNFIVIKESTDEDSPRVNYDDLGADGVTTQIADQEEAPSHSGVVSFDNDSYDASDVVTVTLNDMDLNVDSDLIDIFTVVTDSSDDVFDAVGKAGLPTDLSFGDLGKVLDVTIDDSRWTEGNDATCTAMLIADGIDAGLGMTGFTFVETNTDSGVFLGDFEIPSQFCRENTATPESTTGLDIDVNYVDFRDAAGEIIEVGDSAGIRIVLPPPVPPTSSDLFGLTGSGNSPSSLYFIDPATGAYSLIGSTGFNRCSGMDFDSFGTLFATCDRPSDGLVVLVTIDVNTGLATELGPTGVEAFAPRDAISDISFRTSDGVLFGYGARAGPLLTLDTVTGTATPIGGTTNFDVSTSLAFSPSGTLYHTHGFSSSLDLHTIDPSTGALTFVSGVTVPSLPSFPRCNALEFHPIDGTLFCSIRTGTGNSAGSYLGIIDLSTNSLSTVGPTVDRLDAITIFTEPIIPDHYLGYEAKIPKGEPAFEQRSVHLVDEFGTGTFNVEKPSLLLNPVEKQHNGEISLINDPQTHLEAYKIKEGYDNILVENQFGELFVNAVKAEFLLVPTAISHDDQNVSELEGSLVDHYKCYKVEIDEDSPIQFVTTQATLFDPNFGAEKLFDVKKPKMLCNPVDKNGEGIKNYSNHLMCYDVSPSDDFKKNKKKSIFTNNQFGSEKLDVKSEKQICVPSVTTLP